MSGKNTGLVLVAKVYTLNSSFSLAEALNRTNSGA